MISRELKAKVKFPLKSFEGTEKRIKEDVFFRMSIITRFSDNYGRKKNSRIYVPEEIAIEKKSF